jgi:hypothetical protein
MNEMLMKKTGDGGRAEVRDERYTKNARLKRVLSE